MEPVNYLAAWRTPRATTNSAAKKIFHGREKTIGTAEEVARLGSEVLAVLGPGASLGADHGMLIIAVPDSRLREASADLLGVVAAAGYILYDVQAGRLVVPMTRMAAPWPPEWTGPIAELREAFATVEAADGWDADPGASAEADFGAALTDLAADRGWGLWEVGTPRPPEVERRLHIAPELEALIPDGLVDSDARPTSVRATEYGSRMFNRALRTVGVRPRDAVVVGALGGRRSDVHGVTLIGVPGIAADDLRAAFELALVKPRGAVWLRREIAGRAVWWTESTPGPGSVEAWWARDGLVVLIGGQPAWLEAAVAELP